MTTRHSTVALSKVTRGSRRVCRLCALVAHNCALSQTALQARRKAHVSARPPLACHRKTIKSDIHQSQRVMKERISYIRRGATVAWGPTHETASYIAAGTVAGAISDSFDASTPRSY